MADEGEEVQKDETVAEESTESTETTENTTADEAEGDEAGQ